MLCSEQSAWSLHPNLILSPRLHCSHLQLLLVVESLLFVWSISGMQLVSFAIRWLTRPAQDMKCFSPSVYAFIRIWVDGMFLSTSAFIAPVIHSKAITAPAPCLINEAAPFSLRFSSFCYLTEQQALCSEAYPGVWVLWWILWAYAPQVFSWSLTRKHVRLHPRAFLTHCAVKGLFLRHANHFLLIH